MKWISAAALAAILLFACNKSEETTTSETSASETMTTSTSSTAPADTSGTVVPVGTTATNGTHATTGTTATDTTGTTSTGVSGSTGVTGSSGATGATGQSENLGMPQSMISSSDLVADGMAVYKTKGCAGCHGANGAGDTAIGQKNHIRDFHSPDFQKQSDAELTKILKEGKGQISSMAHKSKNLTDLQVKSLIAYIRTLKG